MPRITVVVADVERDPLSKSAFGDEPDIAIVARATRSSEAVAAVLRFNPRILLCSQRLAATQEYSLFDDIREMCPSTLAVLWSERLLDEKDMSVALTKGAVGVIAGESWDKRLADAIRRIDGGEAWVSRKMLGAIRDELIR